MNLSDKVAIVTGGANGIGEAVVRTLAAGGASVVIADKDEERTDLVAAELRRSGAEVLGVPMNVRDEDQIVDLVATVMQRYGRIDVLDNNAAAVELAGEDHDLLNLDGDVLHETLRVNLLGPLHFCRHVIPHMIENGGGSIVNMASIVGTTGEPRHTAYGISKAGVIQLTRAVATQYGKRGIRSNAVAPGMVITPNAAQFAPPSYVEIYERHTITPQLARPQDVANLVVFLVSDEARLLNGHVYFADGGVMAVNPIVADFVSMAGG